MARTRDDEYLRRLYGFPKMQDLLADQHFIKPYRDRDKMYEMRWKEQLAPYHDKMRLQKKVFKLLKNKKNQSGRMPTPRTPRRVARTPKSSGTSRSRISSLISAGSARRILFRRGKSSLASGYYAGKFATARRKKKTPMLTARKYGYFITEETFGQCRDAHCIYIGQSTHNIDRYVDVIMGAILRKLLRKAGIQVNEPKAGIFVNVTNAVGLRFVFRHYNQTTHVLTSTTPYDTTGGENFESLVLNYSGLSNWLTSWIMDGQSVEQPYEICLYGLYENSATTRLLSNINLVNESISIHISGNITIQNRSSGAEATEGQQFDLDRTDNQPLMGKVYTFKNADPRLRSPYLYGGVGDNKFLNRVREDGLILVRATQFVDDNYEEPPNGFQWANCDKKAKIELEPGQMKKGYISYMIKGKFSNIAKKLSVKTSDEGGVTYIHQGLGRCQMYAFEERIRTSDTNPITIQYEKEYRIGAWLNTTKGPPMQTVLYTGEVNNV